MRILISILFIILSRAAYSQADKLTLSQAVDIALKNNTSIKAAYYTVESQKQLKKTSFDLPKTNVSLLYGQYNGFPTNDNNITISQTIPFLLLGSQGALNRSLVVSSELKKAVTESELIFQVKQVYYQLLFVQSRQTLLLQQDSIYEGFFKAASLRYKTGEANLLEQATAEAQRNEVKNLLRLNESSILVYRTQLQTLLGSTNLPETSEQGSNELPFESLPDTSALLINPSLAYLRQQIDVARSEKKVEAAKFAPDLQVGFFSQTLIDVMNTETGALADKRNRFTGLQVGVSIPLWFVPHQGRVKAASYNLQSAQSSYQHYQTSLQGELKQAAQRYVQAKNSLNYYATSAVPTANLILRQSQVSFRGGEIGYAEYLLGVRQAITIKEGHLQALNDYNQSIIQIEFLTGNK
jgi:heavy metal efflux system protein